MVMVRFLTSSELEARVMASSSGQQVCITLSSCAGDNRGTGIAVDSSRGLTLVADKNNHRVCVFDPHGEFVYSFGGHGTAPGDALPSLSLTELILSMPMADVGDR